MDSNVQITVGGNHTLQEFERLLGERLKYLGETSENVLAASAQDVLKSLRTETRVARRVKIIPPKLEKNIKVGWKIVGKKKHLTLLRGKSELPRNGARVIYLDQHPDPKTHKVYSWSYALKENKEKRYLIVSKSKAEATKKAKEIQEKRLSRFKSLARRAIAALARKIYSTSVLDEPGSEKTNAIANKVTSQSYNVANGRHTLQLVDGLDYALLALKNGKQSVENALKKAANKMVSKINLRMKNLLDFRKLDLPFPEVRQRR